MNNSIPNENLEAYKYLFLLENALRELIIIELSRLEGHKWYKKRLPGDILERYKRAVDFERNITWIKLIPYHPIYYIEFGDLRKILEREDNWNQAFKNIFKRKENIVSIFSDLEFIRNKIAHNRKATEFDLDILKSNYQKIANNIGTDYFNQLTKKSTCILSINEHLKMLDKELNSSYKCCINLEKISSIEIWQNINNQWWFDETYLGNKLDNIYDYYNDIKNYIIMPRERGMGYKIEMWLKCSDIEVKYEKANTQLTDILSILKR